MVAVGQVTSLARPVGPVSLVVVSDNASFHRSWKMQEALPVRWVQGIYLYYLQPYSPDLN